MNVQSYIITEVRELAGNNMEHILKQHKGVFASHYSPEDLIDMVSKGDLLLWQERRIEQDDTVLKMVFIGRLADPPVEEYEELLDLSEQEFTSLLLDSIKQNEEGDEDHG